MKSNFNKTPYIPVKKGHNCHQRWEQIGVEIQGALENHNNKKKIVVVECYHGVSEKEVTEGLATHLKPNFFIHANEAYKAEDEISKMVFPDVTDDRIFGRITKLTLDQYINDDALVKIRKKINDSSDGTIVIIGIGASIIPENYDLLVYADMARWEIQMRMRRQEVNSIGLSNSSIDWMRLYKQGYFADWRVCDQLKKELLTKMDFVLDTNIKDQPKMITGEAMLDGLEQALAQPFSVVPFFDPGPWGGQWMKKFCGLDPKEDNYAWCFNCVPEENSLLLEVDDVMVEIPSINLVFYAPERLLGQHVFNRFGAEFPIRFDFLDTMEGGNLSLQVHPLESYIQEHFGMSYTQDESYYILDAGKDAIVYLGLKENIDKDEMINELRSSQNDCQKVFQAEKYVETWPVKKHDHVLIPAGTVHCSGKDSMVLEISATPYIFTFKLWDWDRLGLDGKPRPINIDHGEKVIQWNRTTNWTKYNLVDRVEKINEGDGWYEEKTGLHELQFIETRRHWFSKAVTHKTEGTVNVLCLVDGDEAIVESPTSKFEPFQLHYAETFVVPASVTEYTVRPFGESEGKQIATLKAFVRS
ncbi:MAG: class I mannose-6-phosphate isomerase [Cyclobacteriaceae bacterium]